MHLCYQGDWFYSFHLMTLSLLYFIWHKGPYGENWFFWGGESLFCTCDLFFVCIILDIRITHFQAAF